MAWGREDSTFDACLEVGSRLIVRLETKIREVLLGIFSMIVKLREGSLAALIVSTEKVMQMLALQSGLYRTMTGEAGPGCTVPWLSNRSAICEEEEDRVEAFRLEILNIDIDNSGFPLEYSCHHSSGFL